LWPWLPKFEKELLANITRLMDGIMVEKHGYIHYDYDIMFFSEKWLYRLRGPTGC
jgi:hypothetical protein